MWRMANELDYYKPRDEKKISFASLQVAYRAMGDPMSYQLTLIGSRPNLIKVLGAYLGA
jgi:hypothetical protein